MKISIDLLKQLRDSTFAPMKDCKEALVKTDWDLKKATEYLKEKWILKAWKKSDRATNEWLTKFKSKWDKFVWIKLLCETDFVAKNEVFLELLDSILDYLLSYNWVVNNISELNEDDVEKINNIISEYILKIWENVKLWDVVVWEKWDSNVFIYNHNWNKFATILRYNWDSEDIAKEISLQITAMNPTYLSMDDVDSDYYNELKSKFEEELKNANKPESMIENIVKWKINKHLSDFVLLEQVYIRDWSKKIKNILPEWFEIKKYIRFAV